MSISVSKSIFTHSKRAHLVSSVEDISNSMMDSVSRAKFAEYMYKIAPSLISSLSKTHGQPVKAGAQIQMIRHVIEEQYADNIATLGPRKDPSKRKFSFIPPFYSRNKEVNYVYHSPEVMKCRIRDFVNTIYKRYNSLHPFKTEDSEDMSTQYGSEFIRNVCKRNEEGNEQLIDLLCCAEPNYNGILIMMLLDNNASETVIKILAAEIEKLMKLVIPTHGKFLATVKGLLNSNNKTKIKDLRTTLIIAIFDNMLSYMNHPRFRAGMAKRQRDLQQRSDFYAIVGKKLLEKKPVGHICHTKLSGTPLVDRIDRERHDMDIVNGFLAKKSQEAFMVDKDHTTIGERLVNKIKSSAYNASSFVEGDDKQIQRYNTQMDMNRNQEEIDQWDPYGEQESRSDIFQPDDQKEPSVLNYPVSYGAPAQTPPAPMHMPIPVIPGQSLQQDPRQMQVPTIQAQAPAQDTSTTIPVLYPKLETAQVSINNPPYNPSYNSLTNPKQYYSYGSLINSPYQLTTAK